MTERVRTPPGTRRRWLLDVFARRIHRGGPSRVVVYGGVGVVFFLFVVTLQVVAGIRHRGGRVAGAGHARMLLLSARAGALAQRIGPRIPMTAGLVVVTIGMVLMTRIGLHTSYLTEVLPAVVVFALGLAAVVAPLTATVLATADVQHAGVASGVNNAVAGGVPVVRRRDPAAGLPDWRRPVARWSFCTASGSRSGRRAGRQRRGAVIR
jgi:hypothetical protein